MEDRLKKGRCYIIGERHRVDIGTVRHKDLTSLIKQLEISMVA